MIIYTLNVKMVSLFKPLFNLIFGENKISFIPKLTFKIKKTKSALSQSTFVLDSRRRAR